MVRNKTAVSFYDLIDSWVGQGIEDFTEGIYHGNPLTPYLEAQRNQHDYLINQTGQGGRRHILDIGCGNGTLMERAIQRNMQVKGITISPIQVQRCQLKGLDVELLDYRDLWDKHYDWNGKFDGVIANGSGEHFVSPEDASRGRQNWIYKDLFDKVKRLLKKNGKFVTTMIHFNRVPTPETAMKNPITLPLGSDDMHYAFVLGNLGCYYPRPGQLEDCAKGTFKLVKEVDGTEDYRLTSEYWLSHLWPSCLTSLNFWKNLFEKGARNPTHTASALFQYVVSQSWNWQFRPGEDGSTPTRLLRQTWEKI